MTNMKSTKKALITSALCLLLCVSMLVGATFAWFTDSVSTTNNVITAGNLDVNLYWSTNGTDWTPVDANTNIFKTGTLWEPGHTEVVYLKVVNEGTLALKYDLIVNVASETEGTNVAGDPFKLSDYILYNVHEGVKTYTDSAAARGTESGNKLNAPYNKAASLEAGKSVELTMVVFMPTTVGNVANYLKDTAIPTINLGINLFATQYTYENDSYGPDYDAEAKPVVVYTAADLAAALTSDEEIISVILGNDIDLPITSLGTITGGSGEYKLGGENTEAITIDLNGNKLNITTTYWSNLGAKNDDAVFTIKNGSMTSSQPTGTWNSYDLTFSNCQYVFENVVFEKAVALESGATLKNVTINETHDYYALWITAEGQNVSIDGLTVNSLGRGIKIDEEYVDAPAKVTLSVSNATFNTNKKAAIMVKSAAGADITLSNVNIANTPDATHAVWVDEDSFASYDLVTVTGGEKIYEGDMITSVSGLQAALDAATDGTVINLGAKITGDVTVTQKPDVKITINGNGNTFAGVITVDGKSARYETAGLTIQNVNFNADAISADAYIRLGHVNAARYTNNVTVKGCTFSGNGIVAVKSYTGGDWNVTIDGCTVNAGMHSLAQFANVEKNLTITNCVVNSKNGANLNNTPSLVMSGCTFNVQGYAVRLGVNSGTNNGTFKITNCALTSACAEAGDAVIILRGNMTGATLDLAGTTLAGTPEIIGTANIINN